MNPKYLITFKEEEHVWE
jgi:hypothetical protein